MADINKFTTKEVLNKVLLDSSGNSVAANSHTSQEALNAVLDTSNNRLNVSLGGSNTISGDVTITGDLTVQGSGTNAYDEIVQGQLVVQTGSSGVTADTNADELIVESNGNAGISILTPNASIGQLAFGSDGDAYGAFVSWQGSANQMTIATANANDSIVLQTANKVTALTIDSSQNVGIGVTPHGTHTDYDALYLGAKGMFTATSAAGSDNVLYIGNNVNRDTDDSLEYIHGDEASMYAQQNGTHTFYVAGSGSAGDNISFTNAMSIDNSGNVGIGTSSPAELLEVEKDQNAHTVIQADNNTAGTGASGGFKASANGADLYMRAFSSSFTTSGRNIQDSVQLLSVGASGGFVIASNDANADMSFWTNDTQRLTIDGATGSVGIGTASPSNLASRGLQIQNTTTSSSTEGGEVKLTSNDGSALESGHRLGGVMFSAYEDSGSTQINGSAIEAFAESNWTGSNNSTFLSFKTNEADNSYLERMRITSGGNVGIGVTPTNYFANYDNLVVGATSGHTGITVVSGNDSYGTIAFADGTSGQAEFEGEIQYRHGSDNELSLGVAGNRRLVIDTNSRISLSNNDSGSGGQDSTSSNTIIGYKAGNAVTSSTINNTFIGHNAGLLANGAVANVVVGTNSADALTTGDHNVALGYFALSASTDVDSVVAIGSGAMESGNVTSAADGSVAIGRNSLLALTSGAGNTAVGMSSLSTGTGFSTNTALGFESGKYLGGNGSANASSLNTCIGAYSMGGGNQSSPSSNTANQNTAIGHGVLGGGTGSSTNITAIKNVGVGYAVMNTVTTAQSNSILGYTAGIAITSGNENVAVGSRALGTADIATFNVAVGGDAMFGIPTGRAVAGVVAIGLEACKGAGATTTGIDGSVAVGRASLKNITTGAGNTAVGFNSAGTLAEGQFNTVLGYNAFDAGQEDSQCVAIGYEALTNADVSDTGSAVATHNTAVGYASGDVVTTGTKNTLIGSATDPSANSGTNQTVIGFSATGVADNSVTLGDADVTAVYMAEDSGAVVHTAGIQFPSGQVANGDANALDDYEEGDHEPTTVVGASSGTYTVDSTNDVLRYTKIGRLVNIQGLILITGDNSASGQLRISLPFTIGDGTGLGGRSYGSAYLTAHGGTIAGRVYAKLEEGNAFFTLVEVADNGTDNDISDSDVDGAFNIGVNFSYTV